MLSCVALLSDMVVTTTPLTNLRVVMTEILLESALAFVRILIFLEMMLIFVPLSLEILFEFLATNLLFIVLTIVVNFRQKVMSLQGAIDDSLLRAHHVYLPEVNHISSQSI